MRNKMVFTRDATQMNIHLKERPTSAQSPYTMCDLSALIQQFSQLRLRNGWRIISEDGEIYAESAAGTQLVNFMDVVSGDESAFSYLQAASMYHVIRSFGPEESVPIESILDDAWVRQLDLFGYWPFEHAMRSLNPIFFYDSLDHPVVIFFTHQKDGAECIAKHIHRFAKVGYGMKYHARPFATLKASS
ncbi:hypothetical protein H0266_10590 [Halobacillus locisalis]|uniref:Uncharacterized protein n=1 Tax=Halobacillus locisalis TaxID=220753 RepID=A0A838CTS4_9BACI|nr:hypothetical protein [Halobacillus locisalis]MBA2175344.1 hypothetical protein [Halobacillus locisalis]